MPSTVAPPPTRYPETEPASYSLGYLLGTGAGSAAWVNQESVSVRSLLFLAWKKKVCEPNIMLSVEYLSLILASMSEKGQMSSAS